MTDTTLPTPPQEPTIPQTACVPGDAECNKRLIEAYSDCD